MSRSLASSALLASTLVTACFGYSEPPPERPAPALRKLESATVLDMRVHLAKQPGLCPGFEGKLYADAQVQWPGSKAVPRTIGSDVDSLAPSSFGIAAPLVKIDDQAHLHPDADILKSVQTGFAATIVYKPNPKFTFTELFPPDYSCYRGAYADGEPGSSGTSGSSGSSGSRDGESGRDGRSGTNGGNGRRGGKLEAVATLVTTRFHERLVAVIANEQLYLAPANRPFELGAAGGYGGAGGSGGSGGRGAREPTKTHEITTSRGTRTMETYSLGPSGSGGDGGSGGNGGNGGDGGTVELTYDAAFPELRELLKVDVSGGDAGYGGAAGHGGSAGSTRSSKGVRGSTGHGGTAGHPGDRGSPGRASVKAGSVSRLFDFPGIAIAGSPAAQALRAQGAPTARK